jgi:hypothetical protein
MLFFACEKQSVRMWMGYSLLYGSSSWVTVSANRQERTHVPSLPFLAPPPTYLLFPPSPAVVACADAVPQDETASAHAVLLLIKYEKTISATLRSFLLDLRRDEGHVTGVRCAPNHSNTHARGWVTQRASDFPTVLGPLPRKSWGDLDGVLCTRARAYLCVYAG